MKILLICGGSGVGKTSIAVELAKNPGFHLIQSYTNRPTRKLEYDHIVIDNQHMKELLQEDLVAMTQIDGYYYCTRFSQFVEDKINVYVVDVKGINDVIDSFPEAEIMTVLIFRKNIYIDEERKNRNIKVPSRDDVSLSIFNDKTIKDCVNVLKSFIDMSDDLYFKKNHYKVMSLEDKFQYHLKNAEYHAQCAIDCQEELECMY